MWAPVTIALLVINAAVFIIMNVYDGSTFELGLVPSKVVRNPLSFATSSLSSMFLHAGVAHIAFNMIALITLGRILEPHIGSKRFTIVYFASGYAGTALHTVYVLVSGHGLNNPVVGASGAIAGIIGIAAALGDRLAIFWLVAQVPFMIFGGSSIAYFAHIGGFILGFAAGRFIKYLEKRERMRGFYI